VAPTTTRDASVSVVRWGLLFGGLVIIADLVSRVATQRTVSPEDQNAIEAADQLVNFILFAILGIVVVRETSLIYMGAITGAFASLLDAIVVAAANSMAPVAGPASSMEQLFVFNLAVGTLFAGVSGAIYVLVQRWSGRRRQK
jgi:hypothetical protein